MSEPTKEELLAKKKEEFEKDPDKFISVDELVMGAKFDEQGRILIMVGKFTIDQLLHVRAHLDDRVQEAVDYIKVKTMQERAEAESIKNKISGGIMGFARRK